MSNPVNYVDPNGEDAMVVLWGDEITIFSNIFIKVDDDTRYTLDIFRDGIEESWMKQQEYYDKDSGKAYKLNWKVNIFEWREGEKENYNGINNYFELISSSEQQVSYVEDYNHGKLRFLGTEGRVLGNDNPIAHEFGHLLGLMDRYTGRPAVPNAGWEGNIMAEPAWNNPKINKRNIDPVFRSMFNGWKKSFALFHILPYIFFLDQTTIEKH